MRRWAPCLLTALVACSNGSKPTPPSPPSAALPAAPVTPAPVRGVQVTQLRGEIEATPALHLGARLRAGQALRVPKGASLQLAFDSGARVDISGPALLAAAGRSDAGLHVREGRLRVDLPPGGAEGGPESGFIATPLGTARLGRSARLVLGVSASGRVQLAVVGGRLSIDVRMPGVTQERVVEAGRRLELDRNQAVGDAQGPSTMEEAERLLFGDQAKAPEGDWGDLQRWQREQLTQALASAEREILRQKALDLEHQEAHQVRSSQVMELQRAIAEQAVLAFRARRELDAILLQVETAQLGASGGAEPDPQLEKARALLR